MLAVVDGFFVKKLLFNLGKLGLTYDGVVCSSMIDVEVCWSEDFEITVTLNPPTVAVKFLVWDARGLDGGGSSSTLNDEDTGAFSAGEAVSRIGSAVVDGRTFLTMTRRPLKLVLSGFTGP